MSIQPSSSYSSSPSCWKYDVFLSFRGEDTRNNFTAHLYKALQWEGINVFKDEIELERGKLISKELLQAIEESRFSIVVLSKKYASSTWCLDELAKIVQYEDTMRQNIIPVFYHVEPYVVRKQLEDFEKAFAKHEETFKDNIEKVQQWRSALTKVAGISGWDTAKIRDESEMIEDIVKHITDILRPTNSMPRKDLVGIEPRLEELMSLIGTNSNDIRMIGICGMGGIGKTTIARVLYESISYQFEGSSFLENVRENSKNHGLFYMQQQLLDKILKRRHYNIYDVIDGVNKIKSKLWQKKVLLVVDDVAHVEELNALIGEGDWFGAGTRIMITTRDEHLLRGKRVYKVYKAKQLNDDEALQLLSMEAFKSHQPPKEYEDLSKEVIRYAVGLPLALKVLGSDLICRNLDHWKSTLERLKRESEDKILNVLQISFDGLRESEKNIFLDIVFFFKGYDRDHVTKILDGCDFSATCGINVLIDKYLITILEGNRLWMHDLLQDLGRQIVKRESPKMPGKRSRLSEEIDIRHVLLENKGTEEVEGLVLDFPNEDIHCSASAISKMSNLRILRLRRVRILEDHLEQLPNNLRLLDWHECPLKFLPQLEKIVDLKLNGGRIEQPWKGIKVLNMLTSISFEDCLYLTKIPDLAFAPKLETLILRGCKRLCEIHPSLLLHGNITFLNMEFCPSLKTLPDKIHMKKLKRLTLRFSSNLKKFPEIVGSMDHLSELSLSKTAIKELPSSIELLTGLRSLGLARCKNLASLPITINTLKSLESLNLCYCSKLQDLPETSKQVESLGTIGASGTATEQPVSSIFLIKNLDDLDLKGCKGAPSNRISWKFLLGLTHRSSNSMGFRLPCLSGLCSSITRLVLADCNLGEEDIPSDFFSSFPSLRVLDLSENNFVSQPGSINLLSNLVYLNLSDCKRLRSLRELPSSLGSVDLNGCASLETLSKVLRSCNLEKIYQISCLNCLKLFGCDSVASSIPEWFAHRTEGSSIRIDKPSDSYNNKLLGYLACCAVVVHKIPPVESSIDTYEVFCGVTNLRPLENGFDSGVDFEVEVGQAVSDHLWLFYFSARELDPVELSFFEGTSSECYEVKKCGIHPVFEQDVKELNTRMNQSSSSTVWNTNEFDQDCVEPMEDVTTTHRRSLADSDISGCCKRLKRF